ncbi:hypothetical protein ILUMI_15503, partial [Ignelater luminosus]
TLEVIEDVIVSPPTAARYEEIKNELIKRLSASQEQRLRQLLEREEIGDRTPSTFLRRLRSLGDNTVSDDLIKSLLLNRLPTTLQAILAVSSETSLNKLAELAVKINESTPRGQVASVSTSNPELETIRKQL